MFKKWILILVIYSIIIFISIYNKELLLDWLNHSDLSQVPIMFFLSLFLAIFPVIPFTLFAGIMGVKFGMLLGGLINLFGAFMAAIFFFFIARYTFAIYFRTYIQRYKRLEKFNSMIERNAFIAVLFARILPIVPTPVINIYSGISKMPFQTYLLATFLGQIPSMFIFAFSGEQMFSSVRTLVFGLSTYMIFVFSVLFVYWIWNKGKAKVV